MAPAPPAPTAAAAPAPSSSASAGVVRWQFLLLFHLACLATSPAGGAANALRSFRRRASSGASSRSDSSGLSFLWQRGTEEESMPLWRPCGAEGMPIEESGLVRFGFGTTWVEATVGSGAQCSVGFFGSDPVPNVRKVCECADDGAPAGSAPRRIDLGIPWTRCATEGETCQCPSGNVRFGVGARWVVAENNGPANVDQAQHLPCALSSFWGADPDHGITKECWCEEPPLGTRPGARVGIVMLSRKPVDLKTWLHFHLGYMGVERIFMDVEDTPDFNVIWSSLPAMLRQNVTIWKGAPAGSSTDPRPADDYKTLMLRQSAAMGRAKKEARSMGIDWLIHIDDDELLYAPWHRSVGDILASMPSYYNQALIPNAEAVYESSKVEKCFVETSEVNVKGFTFVSYANGKSAVRVSDDDAVPAGPHLWKTRLGENLASMHLEEGPFGSPLLVVHFESCPFSRWEDKYWELGNTASKTLDSIPFPFYKESIRMMQQCRNSDRSETGICSEASLRQFWARWKTKANPALSSSDLMPIRIPWDAILASSL